MLSNRSRLIAPTILGLMLIDSVAKADFISFDDGVTGSAVGSHYAVSGITFSNTAWYLNIDGNGNPFSGTTGTLVIVGITSGTSPKLDSPLVAIFSGEVSDVSITASDLGENGARIVAYDSAVGGNQVGMDELIGSGAGVGVSGELTISGGGIRRIELYQPRSTGGDGVVWDNLRFTPGTVPEPTSVALLSAGAFGVLGHTLRRRHRVRHEAA